MHEKKQNYNIENSNFFVFVNPKFMRLFNIEPDSFLMVQIGVWNGSSKTAGDGARRLHYVLSVSCIL